MNLPSHELLGPAWTQVWQVSVLIVAVGLATYLLCRSRPHLAYVLWLVVVLKCLTPPLWSSPTGVFSWVQSEPPRTAMQRVPLPAAPVRSAAAIAAASTPQAQAPVSPVTPAADSPSHTAGDTTPHASAKLAWPAIAAPIWLVGLAVLACIGIWQWLFCWRRVRRFAVDTPAQLESLAAELAEQLGLRRKVRLLVTTAPIGPATTGVLRPAIVLPLVMVKDAGNERIRPILAHELIHVRRNDALFGLLQSAAQLLLWFHPLVWWANRQASREVERCCDQEVVAGLECQPAAYAHCLVDVLQFKHDLSPLLPFSGIWPRSVTRQRLEDIMTRAASFHRRTPAWCWIILLPLAALTLPGRGMVIGQGTPPVIEPVSDGALEGVAEPADAPPAEATVVTGQVLDPSGRPVPGVPVGAAVCRPTRYQRPGPAELIAEGVTDVAGRFELVGRKVSEPDDVALTVFAYAAGCQVASANLQTAGGAHEATLRLEPEEPVRGKVVDPQGRPVAGARIELLTFAKPTEPISATPVVWFPAGELAARPAAVVTDAMGQFTLRGVTREALVVVRVRDPRFAPFVQDLRTGRDVTLTMAAPKPLEGTVLYRSNNKPVADAVVTAISYDGTGDGGYRYLGQVQARTDAKGNFSLVPYKAYALSVSVAPSEGEVYELIWWKDAKEVMASKQTLLVPDNVIVRGRVIEQPGGRPVVGARIQYQSRSDEHGTRATSDRDGGFMLRVKPARGALLVQAPTPDYVKREVTGREIYRGEPGGTRLYPDGYAEINPGPGATELEVTVLLRRGVTVRGYAIGPDGKPVAEGMAISNTHHPYDTNFEEMMPIPIRDGKFEVPGVDPSTEQRVYLVDPKNQCGAAVVLSGKAAQPATFRLEPCGSATARFVDLAGQPYGGYKLHDPPYITLTLVLAPGVSGGHYYDGPAMAATDWFADNIDPRRYQVLRMDAEGAVTFPTLIPGAEYRVMALNQRQTGDGKKDFVAVAGQTLDLGRLVVERGN